MSRSTRGFAVIHNKLWIIDGSKLVTGSVNPTLNGFERNDENLVVITHEEAVLAAKQQVDELFKHGTEVDAGMAAEMVRAKEQTRSSRSRSAGPLRGGAAEPESAQQ